MSYILVLIFKIGFGTAAVVLPDKYRTFEECQTAAQEIKAPDREDGWESLRAWACVKEPHP